MTQMGACSLYSFEHFGQFVECASASGASHNLGLEALQAGGLDYVAAYLDSFPGGESRRFDTYGVLPAIEQDGAEIDGCSKGYIFFRCKLGVAHYCDNRTRAVVGSQLLAQMAYTVTG